MSRFTDYCSSAITPQMTLLEKFNALLKYLKENESLPKFYKHTINNKIILITNSEDNINSLDKMEEEYFKRINIFVNSTCEQILRMQKIIVGASVLQFAYYPNSGGTSLSTISISSNDAIVDVVELF